MDYNVLSYYGTVGKDTPKAYFFGTHKYFDIFYREISKLGRISLCYDSGLINCDKADKAFELAQMDLFIVAVTPSLLDDLPESFKEDYSFALSNNIPLLPIIFEKVADDRYAEVFGTKHYLVYDSKPTGSNGFINKLESYFSALLVSPELVERIKAAFSGYVFLSYRKKDRMHIPAIMRAIHANEDFIDVAVWYDEFLTPGEKFDELIEQKMKNSDAFLLSVTPNLLEEGNYVMEKEYPFAKKANMPILPVEVEATDADGLQRYYSDFPICKSIKAVDEITADLKEKIGNKINRLVATPERDYLIGLAYLFGIDVEIDRERGFRLIEKAAAAGYGEALSKLSVQKQHGDGLESKIGRELQQRYVDICREKYERESTSDSICEYADALDALANIQDTYCYYDYKSEAEHKYRPVPEASVLMIDILERECESKYNEKVFRRLIKAYSESYKYYGGRMSTAKDNENRLKAIELLKRMAERNPTAAIFEEIAGYYASFIADGMISLSHAMHYHVEALEYYCKAYGEAPGVEQLKTCFKLCDSIGEDAFLGGYDDDRKTGCRHWAASLRLGERILKKDPTEENAKKLCECYAYYCETVGDRVDRFHAFDAEERVGYCLRAIEIVYQYLDGPDTDDSGALFTLACVNLADAYFELGEYDKALDNYRAAMFVSDPDEKCSIYRIKNSLWRVPKDARLGYFKCLAELGRASEAENEAYGLLRALKLGTKEYEMILDTWIRIKDARALSRFATEYLSFYYEPVWKGAENNKFWKNRMLCELYSRCRAAYEICLEADFKSAALIYFSRAVSAYQQTVGNDRTAVYDLTQMCIELGDLYAELDDASGAYRCYLAGVKNAAALDNAEASERELYLMSSSKIKLGAHYEAEEQFDLAEKYYAEAYVYSVRIFHITKNKDDVYEVSHRLSELYAKQGGVLFVIKKLAALRKKIKI